MVYWYIVCVQESFYALSPPELAQKKFVVKITVTRHLFRSIICFLVDYEVTVR